MRVVSGSTAIAAYARHAAHGALDEPRAGRTAHALDEQLRLTCAVRPVGDELLLQGRPVVGSPVPRAG